MCYDGQDTLIRYGRNDSFTVLKNRTAKGHLYFGQAGLRRDVAVASLGRTPFASGRTSGFFVCLVATPRNMKSLCLSFSRSVSLPLEPLGKDTPILALGAGREVYPASVPDRTLRAVRDGARTEPPPLTH